MAGLRLLYSRRSPMRTFNNWWLFWYLPISAWSVNNSRVRKMNCRQNTMERIALVARSHIKTVVNKLFFIMAPHFTGLPTIVQQVFWLSDRKNFALQQDKIRFGRPVLPTKCLLLSTRAKRFVPNTGAVFGRDRPGDRMPGSIQGLIFAPDTGIN